MFKRPHSPTTPWPITETASGSFGPHFQGQTPRMQTLPQDYADSRHVKLAMAEPKRRLIRDARVLCRSRGITQGQMADELGISRRTLEEWMQFRRMPQAPSESLLRQWVAHYSVEFDRPIEPAF